jgi:hypothetical protein
MLSRRHWRTSLLFIRISVADKAAIECVARSRREVPKIWIVFWVCQIFCTGASTARGSLDTSQLLAAARICQDYIFACRAKNPNRFAKGPHFQNYILCRKGVCEACRRRSFGPNLLISRRHQSGFGCGKRPNETRPDWTSYRLRGRL